MKILHISPYAELGGCEFNALSIIQEIEADHEVLLLNNGAGPFVEKWKNANAKVFSIDILSKPFYTWPSALKNQLKHRACHYIIYWSHMHLPPVLSAIEPFTDKVLVHIGNPINFGLKQKLLRKYQNARYGFDSSKVELRPVSAYVAQSMENIALYKSLKKKVSFKPIVLDDFEALHSKTFTIGMLARLDNIKDYPSLIKATKIVLDSGRDVQLLIGGEGREAESLKKLCRDLRISEKVKFLGSIQNKIDYYKKLNLFVYATTEAEGLAGVVGEALVAGIPTICSDLPMLHEWDSSAKVIEYFPLKNIEALAKAIENAIEYQDERWHMAQNNKMLFKDTFNAKAFALNYLSIE